MKRYLPFLIIAAVAVLTVAGGTMFYRQKMRAAIASSARGATTTEAASKPLHVRGEADATVTIEEFADFQCPSCALAFGVMQIVEKDYGSRLRIIFREFPLDMHKHGRDAALAAEAAGMQGHFWEMHDLLYQHQVDWSDVPDVRPIFDFYAESLHLDVTQFEKDRGSHEAAERVENDQSLGQKRGVQTTPTIFINNEALHAPYSLEHLHEEIDAAMAGRERH